MLIISLAAAIVVLAALLVGAWRLLNGGVDNSVTRVVSGPVTLGTGEQRFIPSDPLRFERQSSKVLLHIDGASDVDFSKQTVALSDGSEHVVSVLVETASGKRYPLVSISMGSAIGFGFSDTDRQTLSPSDAFVAVLVRADAPVPVSAIEWYSWTGK